MIERFDTPRTDKPWGYELLVAQTDVYVGKVLHVTAGQALSLQYHERKDETIHVLKGEIVFRVQIDGELVERRMGEGESYRIVPRTVHQMEAVTAADLLEASTPEVDDVVRLKDRYGRV